MIKLRKWLIKKLAGEWAVMINFCIEDAQSIDHNSPIAFVHQCVFFNDGHISGEMK